MNVPWCWHGGVLPGGVNCIGGAARQSSSSANFSRRGSLPSAWRQTMRSSAMSRSNMVLNASHSAAKLSTCGSRPRLTARANWLKFEPNLLTAPVSDPMSVRSRARACRSTRERGRRYWSEVDLTKVLVEQPRARALARTLASSSSLSASVQCACVAGSRCRCGW